MSQKSFTTTENLKKLSIKKNQNILENLSIRILCFTDKIYNYTNEAYVNYMHQLQDVFDCSFVLYQINYYELRDYTNNSRYCCR